MLQIRFKSLVPTVTLAAAVVTMSGTAFAQSAPKVSFMPAAAPAATPAPAPSLQSTNDAYWDWVGGIEFDTDGLFYGALGPSWNKPLSDNMRLSIGARPSWLQYEFEESGGTTKISGPGVSTSVGLRFGDRNTFKVSAGPSFRWKSEKFIDASGNEIDVEDSEDEGLDVGFNVGADAYLNPTDRDNVHLIASYNTESQWMWTRGAYKHQISNHNWQGTWAHFLGGEAIMQGNDDIRIWMFGGLVEFTHAPSSTSLAFRAGYKRSTFETGDDRTGPYFGLNFYKRMGRR